MSGSVPRPGPAGDALIVASLLRVGHLLSAAVARGAASRLDVLRALCDEVVRAVDVDGVGVMLVDGEELRFVDAEPQWVVGVERLQEQHGRGPCWDSVREHRIVLTPDARVAVQWPELAARAGGSGGDQVGFAAVASLPLLAQGRAWGVLDLYRRRPRVWTGADLVVAGHCAQVAASYLVLAAERDRWQSAWSEVEHRSGHDELTGLPGRRMIFDRLDRAIAAATRRGAAVAVLFVDVDAFQAVDEVQVHAVGDATLVEVTHRLGLTLRATDTLARLSGAEFVIVCDDLTGTMRDVHAWLSRLGERILLELRRPAAGDEVDIDVTVSIGAAVTTRDCSSQTLTAQADHARYAAKHSGGGRLVISRAGSRP